MRLPALTLVLLLAACKGGSPPAPPAPPASATAAVTGTVTYRERIMLPPSAVLTVRLSYVSRADAAAMVLAEQQITPVRVPAAFSLAYDPSAVDERDTYVVQARIEDNGKLLFVNTSQYQVITRGNPVGGVAVLVQGVGR